MEVLQWIDTAFRAVLASLFMVIPGVVIWLVVLGVSLLGRWISRNRLSLPLRAGPRVHKAPQ